MPLNERDVLDDFPRTLPDLDLEQEADLSGDSAFASYFQLYGFDQIKHSQDAYYFGALPLAGYRIATHVWCPQGAQRSILVVPGLFDHAGLYLSLVRVLLDANYALVLIDLPGHGLSSGARAAIDDFNEYGQLIAQSLGVIGQTSLPSLSYVVGQSTGGAALMNYVLGSDYKKDSIEKIVLLAPLIKPRAYTRIRWIHGLFSPFLQQVARRFSTNSHNDDFVRFLAEEDPLQPRHVSVSWVGAMIKEVRRFAGHEHCDIPVLVIQGSGDKTVDFRDNIPQIQRVFTRCHIHYVRDAMHHLMGESDDFRVDVFAQLIAFLDDE